MHQSIGKTPTQSPNYTIDFHHFQSEIPPNKHIYVLISIEEVYK